MKILQGNIAILLSYGTRYGYGYGGGGWGFGEETDNGLETITED